MSYSFLPADGVERIIRLRARVRQRLRENAEVVGTDGRSSRMTAMIRPCAIFFTEKAGILDGDADGEVDMASYAYQIWKNAVGADPALEKTVADLPPVVYSTRAHKSSSEAPARFWSICGPLGTTMRSPGLIPPVEALQNRRN